MWSCEEYFVISRNEELKGHTTVKLTSTASSMATAPKQTATAAQRINGSAAFDWLMIGLAVWLVGGLFLDGWAHHHLDSALETFLTPWHAVFYSSFFATVGVLGGAMFKYRRAASRWYAAIPAGYELSLAGIALFFVGGIGDGIWHTLFGIESDVEALVSPTHLMIAIGMMLIISGPYRARRLRAEQQPTSGWGDQAPSILSLTLTLALLSFFLQFAHPLVETWTMTNTVEYAAVPLAFRQEFGLSTVLITSITLAGALLVLVGRHERLPFGSLTALLGINTLAMSALHDQYAVLPGALIVGLLADVLARASWAHVSRITAARMLATIVPALFAANLLVTLGLTGELTWSIHMWTGTLVLTPAVGWLMSYVATAAIGERARVL